MAGVTDKSYLFALSDAVSEGNAADALSLVASLREKSIDIKRLCEELIFHYRNLLLAGVKGGENLLSGISTEDEKAYAKAAPQISQKQAIFAIKALGSALDKMGRGTDARIELELALFNLCEKEDTPATVPPQPTATASLQYSAPQSYAPPVPFAQAPVNPQTASAQPTPPTPQTEQIAQSAPMHTQSTAPTRQPQSVKLPIAEQMEQAVPFEQWQQVITAMEQKDKCLFVNMNNSKAYFDGRRVLIDASDLFTEYMRTNAYSKGLIKEVIEEVTGKRYGIGPYEKAKQAETRLTAHEELNALAEQGVEVIISE
ncbi:MAG: hypothetical protein RR271_03100 [Oscillospiraceae bacterium]